MSDNTFNKEVSPNYIKIINWFWDTAPYQAGYKASHAALFFAILDSINRNRWVITSLPYDYLINKCKIGNHVYLEGRKWLIENGMIEVVVGKNAYQMAQFRIPVAMLNSTATNTPIDTDIDPATNGTSTPLSTHIIKHKTIKQVNIHFDVFWNLYDKKKGSKEKCKMLWEKLTDEERQKSIDHIPFYKKEKPDEQFRKFPEGYLRNKYFNNDTDKPKETIISNDYADGNIVSQKYN